MIPVTATLPHIRFSCRFSSATRYFYIQCDQSFSCDVLISNAEITISLIVMVKPMKLQYTKAAVDIDAK